MLEGLNTKPKNPLEEHAHSEVLQNEFLNLVEESYKEYLQINLIPKNERKMESVFNNPDKPPTFIEQTHKLEYESPIWLIVDFDDVINKTTTYNNQLKKKVCEITNLKKEEYSELYKKSKIANQDDKKVFRFNVLIEKIKKLNPGQETEIDKLITEGISAKDFVDQGVKRALLSLARSGLKISILTFGDINYQKGRIDKTDLGEIVSEIIYTEGSKREVLETLLEKNYKSKGIVPPFIVSIDDSPEQINDYNDVSLPNNFVNMHFENPQASRFGKKPDAEEVITNTETKHNEAAINIYKMGKICLDANMHKSKKQIFELLQGKNIRDFYQERNKYDMGEERKARMTDSEGRISVVHFSNRKPSESEMNKMIGEHSLREFYDSVLFANPTIETNIFYSKENNGDIFHESDLLISKEKKGHTETTKKTHKASRYEKRETSS